MSATRKTEPTLEGFRDFCASKPADETYSYAISEACAITQYVRAIGYPEADCSPSHWSPTGSAADDRPLPDGFNEAANQYPRTFGALTARLRSQVAK